MKIIIADDELMLRLSLISMLEDLEGADNTIIQARNGRELVELVRTQRPDVAFIDIKMPLLSGLDALREAKIISPQTVCIMLTGHAEFQFAQSAISYGAFEYLLKPVSLPKLRDVLGRVHKKLTESWKLGNANLTKEIYENHILNIEHYGEETEVYRYRGAYDLALIYSGIGSQVSVLNEELNNLYKTLKRSCSSNYAVFRPFSDILSCIIVELSCEDAREAFCAMKQRLLDSNFCVFSQNVNSLPEAMTVINYTESKAILRLLHSRSTLSIDELTGSEQNRLFCRSLYETVQAIEQENRFLFECWIARLESAGTAGLEPHLAALKKHFPILGNVANVQDIAPFLHKIGMQCFSNTDDSALTLADFVKEYIDRNYHHDIGTAVIADTFNVTPNYLSGIFKKKFDIGLVAYLTNVRMKKARQMLKNDPAISITQLSSAVGYSAPSYFTKVFRKTYGMLPSEFVRQLGAGNPDTLP